MLGDSSFDSSLKMICYTIRVEFPTKIKKKLRKYLELSHTKLKQAF